MRPQLDAKTYCSANLEVWDDVFFRYHIDCSTVVLSVDDKNNSKIVFSNTRECFLKPPPNYLERNTSFESSLQHVYEMMDVINVKMTENEQTEDQSDWVLPKKSFHSDVNPRSFARVASSIEICDLLVRTFCFCVLLNERILSFFLLCNRGCKYGKGKPAF